MQLIIIYRYTKLRQYYWKPSMDKHLTKVTANERKLSANFQTNVVAKYDVPKNLGPEEFPFKKP